MIAECQAIYSNCDRPPTLLVSFPYGERNVPACVGCGNYLAELFGACKQDDKDAGRPLRHGRYRVKRVWLSTRVVPT